jgi:pilus assembly protein CpaC
MNAIQKTAICLSFVLCVGMPVYAQDSVINSALVDPDSGVSDQSTAEAASTVVEPKKDPELSFAKNMGQEINLATKQSQLLKFDQEVKRTAVANPDIADIVPINTKEVLIVAKAHGVTTLIIWTSEEDSYLYNVSVKADGKHLLQLLMAAAPNAELEVYPTDTSFAVKGFADSNLQITKLMEVAESYSPGAVNMLKIKEPKQVLLETRMAEIDRSRAERLGVDIQLITQWWAATMLTGGANALESDPTAAVRGSFATFPQLLPVATAPTTAASGTTFDFAHITPNHWFSAAVEALQQANVLKLIARPNIMAKDGEQASFLVGGEFPVVVVTSNTINIEFKEFGTKLNFKPEFLDNETMKMTIEPEVSELDSTSGVTLTGVVVPGLITRKSKTVVDLKDGQSFVIGGLLFDSVTRVHNKIPLIGDIPYLGMITKRSFDRSSEKEVIVMVTPHVVKPLHDSTGHREVYPIKQVESMITYIDAQTGGLREVKLNENVEDIAKSTPRLLPWLNNTKGFEENPKTLKQLYRDVRDTLKPAQPEIQYANDNTHGLVVRETTMTPVHSSWPAASSEGTETSSKKATDSDSSYLDGM